MRIRFGVIASLLLAAAMVSCAGCGDAANEEGLDKTKAVATGEAKTFKNYGEYALEKAEQTKKDMEATKGKNGKTKKP
jgi:hypothetical protein